MYMDTLIQILNTGGVAVIATDTLYGIVGRAFDQNVVESIYRLKKRDEHKPFIILISNVSQLEDFGIELQENQQHLIEAYWRDSTRPLSIILPITHKKEELTYLHRGSGSIAFRLPQDEYLQKLIEITGPLVAPSANPQGQPSPKNCEQARAYFGDNVAYYDPRGIEVSSEVNASRIIRIYPDGREEVLRA